LFPLSNEHFFDIVRDPARQLRHLRGTLFSGPGTGRTKGWDFYGCWPARLQSGRLAADGARDLRPGDLGGVFDLLTAVLTWTTWHK
jgi:hypothetical protein